MGYTGEERLFKRHYPELDLLRTVAIGLVMLRHFGDRGYHLPPDAPVTHFIYWGSQGVVLFFVLSGFLIGGQILEEVQAGRFSLKRFYFKRLLRIFPPYYASIIVVSILFFAGIADKSVVMPATVVDDFVKDVFYHVLYLQNYISSPKMQTIYWSLGVEEQFYIAAPFVLLLFLRYSPRWLMGFFAAFLVLDMALRLVQFEAGRANLESFELPFYTYFSTIAFGVLAAYVFIRYGGALRSFRALRFMLLMAFAAGLFMSLVVGGEEMSYFNVCFKVPFAALSFASLILFMTTGRSGGYVPLKGFFALIARFSYTMYLYHLMLVTPLVAFSVAFWRVDSYFDFFSIFVLYSIGVVAVSAVVYRFVDRPFMAYRKRAVARMENAMGPARATGVEWPARGAKGQEEEGKRQRPVNAAPGPLRG